MIFKVALYQRIPPLEKMIWLAQMHDFILKTSTAEDLKRRWKLRGFDVGLYHR